jgi:hypothetical protein
MWLLPVVFIDASALDTAKVAASFGYTPAELLAIPTEANLGLSCGNPVGAATLNEVNIILTIFSFPRGDL